MLGGGMRQVGIIAAAGIVALETMVNRLVHDHANAKRLAQGLATIKGITLEQDFIPTNIVMFTLTPNIPVSEFNKSLEKAGVKLSPRGGNLFRAVTHRMISSSDIDEALARIKNICQNLYSN
jgi:threonine aldolase